MLLSPDSVGPARRRLRLDDAPTLVADVRALCAAEPHASARAAAMDPAALERLERALARPGALFDDIPYEDREAALASWSDLVTECLPALGDQLSGDIEGDAHFLVRTALQRAPLAGHHESEGGRPVVHGVRWTYEDYDPCPPCGIGYFPDRKRNFDAFLDE